MIAGENGSERKYHICWIIHCHISVWHAYMHSLMKRPTIPCFLCVYGLPSSSSCIYKSIQTAWPGHPTTEQNTPGLEALICCATQKRSKKHRQTIGKAKRKAKYADIVLKRLNALISSFQSLITHDWTRLKILRNGSHYRANNIVLATTQMLLAGDWTTGECRRYIKQHVLLSDRSSKWLSFIRLMIKSTDSCNV